MFRRNCASPAAPPRAPSNLYHRPRFVAGARRSWTDITTGINILVAREHQQFTCTKSEMKDISVMQGILGDDTTINYTTPPGGSIWATDLAAHPRFGIRQSVSQIYFDIQLPTLGKGGGADSLNFDNVILC